MQEFREALMGLLTWLQSLGSAGAFWLVVLQAMLVVAAIPGPYFTLAAGFLFGVAGGGTLMIVAATLGATVAYGLARTSLGRRFDAWLNRFGWVPPLKRFLAAGGFRVVLSTRLLPFFPFKLSNYLFGAIGFPFWPLFAGTVIGIIPVTLISVSTGSLASNLASVLDPAAAVPPWKWAVSAGTLVASLSLFYFTTRSVRAQFRLANAKERLG